MQLKQATIADWDAIRAIYHDGILTGEATFNTAADIGTGEAWFAGKIATLTFKAVADDGTMLGWSTVSPVSKRRVYAGIGEISVYVAADAQGRGVGSALVAHTLQQAENQGMWMIEARIFPTNQASLHLHTKHGFRVLGTHHHRAQQFGVWRDVVTLEWRSTQYADLFPVALATPNDFNAIVALLQAAGLPHGDLSPAAMSHFLVCREHDTDTVQGCIGFERYGQAALLRSLAVADAYRGRG